jgi:hypothetical protein
MKFARVVSDNSAAGGCRNSVVAWYAGKTNRPLGATKR